MPGGEKCPPITRFPRPKDPPRKPEHPKHPTKPPAPEPRKPYPTQNFGGLGCFTPAVENPTHGPYEPKIEDFIWKDGRLVEIRDEEWRAGAQFDAWTVRGLCARPAGVTGPVPFVLMMHQAGRSAENYRGYRELQTLLASHGIASVSASDNGLIDETFKHPGLEFQDEARRAALCIQLAERFASARSLRFGPRIGLLGHSRGGYAAQNLANLINGGSDNLFGLADNPAAFRNVRVEGLCLVGSSSFHAEEPTCPILLLQGSRDEDLVLDPSWYLAGRRPAGYVSVAYVVAANHNGFNSVAAAAGRRGGRRGPVSGQLLPAAEHVRILTGLAAALFLETLLSRPTALLNGTAQLPNQRAEPSYQIAFRASDCIGLIRNFGSSSVERGVNLDIDRLTFGGSSSADVDVHAAVFGGLQSDAEEWPEGVSTYTSPFHRSAAMICCGHGLVIRVTRPRSRVPPGGPSGLRLPLPTRLDLTGWSIAVTAAAVDMYPSYVDEHDALHSPNPDTGFYVGVETDRTLPNQVALRWSAVRPLAPNDDLQAEWEAYDGDRAGPNGFFANFCVPRAKRKRHIPVYCRSSTEPGRNNGTTAYAVTHWFPPECFMPKSTDSELNVGAIWLYPAGSTVVAVQRVDLFRRLDHVNVTPRR